MAGMRVRVRHHIDRLADRMAEIPVQAGREMATIVRENAKYGRDLAKASAKESAGKHGKHYYKAIGADRLTSMSWEYGPDAEMLQGDMSFEFGSRNQKPHLDLARSADVAGAEMARDVRRMLTRLRP
jgi:hypothetical protein